MIFQCRHSTGNFIITHRNQGGGQLRLKLTDVTTLMTSPYDWSSAQSKNEDYAINSFVTPSKCARNYIYVYKMEEKHKKGTVQKNSDMERPSDITQTDRKNKENNEQHEYVDRDSLLTENYHVDRHEISIFQMQCIVCILCKYFLFSITDKTGLDYMNNTMGIL